MMSFWAWLKRKNRSRARAGPQAELERESEPPLRETESEPPALGRVRKSLQPKSQPSADEDPIATARQFFAEAGQEQQSQQQRPPLQQQQQPALAPQPLLQQRHPRLRLHQHQYQQQQQEEGEGEEPPFLNAYPLRKYHSISKVDDLDKEYLPAEYNTPESVRPRRLLSTQSQDLSYLLSGTTQPQQIKTGKNLARRLSVSLIEKISKSFPFGRKSSPPSSGRDAFPPPFEPSTAPPAASTSRGESSSSRPETPWVKPSLLIIASPTPSSHPSPSPSPRLVPSPHSVPSPSPRSFPSPSPRSLPAPSPRSLPSTSPRTSLPALSPHPAPLRNPPPLPTDVPAQPKSSGSKLSRSKPSRAKPSRAQTPKFATFKSKRHKKPLARSMSSLSDRPHVRSSLGSSQPPPEGPPPSHVWPISKGYVETPEGQIHYRRCGDGPPVVLMLHGSPLSSAMFSSALPRMAAKGITCIAMDLPNSGESYITKTEPTLDDLTNAVMTTVHKLGFAFPFSIIGHQSGSSLALHLAVEYPNLISKLALWGIPIVGIIGRGDILREEAPDYANELMDNVNTFVTSNYPPEGYPWQLKVRGLVDMLRTYDRRNWGNRPIALVDAEGLLKKIRQPVLCMAGGRETYQKSTMKAAVLLQAGKYLELGPAGSDVVDEFPDDFVQNISDFFKVAGMPLERSSCTIPSSLSPMESAWFQKMGNRFEDVSSRKPGSENLPNVYGDGKDEVSERGSLRKSGSRASGEERGSGEFVRTDSKSGDSDSRRSSTEKKRLSLKNLVKGKFLAS